MMEQTMLSSYTNVRKNSLNAHVRTDLLRSKSILVFFPCVVV